MASPAQPPKTPEAPREAPHFEISVEDGRGQLLLRPRRFFGWLEVERLELAIPHVTFPLDITGGMAQFQRQRCPVQAATFAVGAAGLFELVGRRAAALQAAGFEEVRLAPLGGAIELTAQARVRERSVELIARLRLEGGARDLRVRLDEALTIGWVRRPSMLLAHDLLCILFSAIDSGAGGAVEGDGDGPTVRGLGEIALRPLELFAAAVLSPAGWRLPEVSEVRLGEIAIGAGGVRLSFTSEPGQAAASPARAIGLARVEELLLHSDLAGAISACREAILAEPDFAQPLTKHLLDLLCSRDSSLREAELIARDALRRWPDFLHARLSLAAAAVARDRNGEAAEQLAEAARLAEAHPGALAVRATLAAARAAVDEAPAQAIALFEQAAERCPGDERVVAALGVEYAKAGRWPELARLYQAQLAIEAPPLSRAATLLKMGELLALRLHDPDGARRHLEEATRLDPRSRRAFELYADLSAQLGDRGAAISALTRSAALLEEADDALAESRTRARIGLLCEAEGDLTQAREQYRRALARTPDDPGVLQAFAALAEAQHDTADALDAYQRLAHSPSAARESRRTAQEKLLGLYIEVEDLASARRALAERSGEPDGETLARLARLEESMGEMVPAAELLARAAAQSSGPRRAELELDRARLYRLAGDREDERAALERAHALSREGGIGEGAARGLSLLAREGGEAEAEAKWLDDLIARAPADRDELSLRRAELHQLAGDAQSAKRLLDAIGEPARSRSEHARLYADVLGALGDPLGRATLLESLAAAGAGESAEERAALWAHAAESRLAAGDVAAAHRAALAAERLAATSSRVRAVVAEVAWRRRAWEEVVTLYDELFGDSRGAERVENGRRLGVALERLGQPKEALAIFERALGAEDAAGAAVELVWRACAEAHERAGDYPRTAETLKKAASDPRTGAPPAARAEILRRAAELLHRRAGASAQAAALYEEALALGVEQRITLDALEALHAESGDAAELERTLVRKLALPPTTAHERVESLARLTELAGGDQARRTLADALTTAAAQSEDPARAAGWLKEAAELRAHVGDFSGAAEALLAAVTLAPGPALYAELETLLTDLGEWARLVALYEAQLESLDGEARRPLVEKLLRVCEGALADEARAARFRSELGRDRAGAAQVSVAALVRTVSSEPVAAPKNDRLAAAIEHAERKRAALPSDQILAIRASHLELGQLYRQAERWDAADEELRAVLSEEPSHRVALEALCEVAERRGDFATAARASGELAHLVDDPGARAVALFREGELYLTRLGDEERAAESYLKAIDLDPAHAPTVRRLIDYFWSAGDRSSVVELVASLDPAAFAAPETSAETRARAALSAALAGDRATPRLAAALGPGGALAVARSIADGLARGLTPAALTQALKLLCAGRELPLAEVRRALARLAATDPRLAPLLTQL